MRANAHAVSGIRTHGFKTPSGQGLRLRPPSRQDRL